MEMARLGENLRETCIIPDGCREAFLALDGQAGAPLRTLHVSLAGLSDLMPGYIVARASPSYHVVLFTVLGAGKLEVEGQTFLLEPGEFVFLPAGTAYRYRVAGDRWEVLWFHLRRRKRWEDPASHGVRVESARFGSKLLACAQGMLDAAAPGREAGLWADLLAVYLRRQLLEDAPAPAALHEAAMAALWKEVASELSRPWSVGKLARRAHLSPSQFHRLCVQYFNQSPMERLTALRMERAAQLLLQTGDAVYAIATRVGYENPYAFSTAFRRVYGRSPRDFRRAG